MNKQEFMATLQRRLAGLPQDEIEERLSFYSEMIEDRMEEGLTEEAAVVELGTIDEIVSQIMSEIPLAKLVKEKVKPKRTLRAWEIVLLALGSPIWFSLLIAVLAVILATYAAVWSGMIALWAAELAAAASAIGGIVGAVAAIVQGNLATGIALIGAGLVCAGITIFVHYGCMLVLKGILALSKRLFLGIKTCFVKKEVA